MNLSISNSLLLLTMIFTLSLLSCGDANINDNEIENSGEIQDTLYLQDKEDSLARRVRLSDRIKTLEIDLDREITELDRKLENATVAEKVKWEIRREKLAMEREQLKNDLDNLGEEVSNDWQQLEEDIADRLDRISEDLRDDN